MSKTLWRLQTSARARSHSGLAALTPPSPCTVSTMTAAGLSTPLLASPMALSQVLSGVDAIAHVAIEGHARDAAHVYACASSVVAIACRGECA